MKGYAEVVFPLPLSRSFTYLLPAGLRNRARVGCRVAAPFGTRLLTGYLVHLRSEAPPSAGEIKEIHALLDDAPVFTPRFLAFTRRLSRRYASSWGEFLAASLPPSLSAGKQPKLALTDRGETARVEGRLPAEEARLAEALSGSASSPLNLKRKLKKDVSSTIARMRAKNLVEDVPARPVRRRRPAAGPLATSPRQLALGFPPPAELGQIVSEILAPVRTSPRPRPFLLLGGRPAREDAYEMLVQAAWQAGGRVLFLVPEISSSEGFHGRFERKWPGSTAIFHSRLTPRQKDEQWAGVLSGRAKLVAGPRSALFLPLTGLKLVVLEEEQDDSFLQEENPSYDARSGAALLGRAMGAVAVFGSARPSVESRYAAASSERIIRLAPEPALSRVQVVDMRGERSFLAPQLVRAITDRIGTGERMILFLNRRGYAAALVCAHCGRSPLCGRCRIPVFYLKRKDLLVCRTCSSSRPAPRACPECGAPLRLAREPGVEAVQDELKGLFPRLKMALFDPDIAGRPAAREKILDRFRRGSLEMLVATRLLAYRSGAPRASLVAVLNPESLLSFPDYKSGQRAYEALSRMMDLASGRGSLVLVQTALPEHHALAAAMSGDAESFYREELEFRRLLRYPPFFHLAEVAFQGKDLRQLGRRAREFGDRVRGAGDIVEVLGPSRGGGFRPGGRERVWITLRAARRAALLGALDAAQPLTRGAVAIRLAP